MSVSASIGIKKNLLKDFCLSGQFLLSMETTDAAKRQDANNAKATIYFILDMNQTTKMVEWGVFKKTAPAGVPLIQASEQPVQLQ